jgi:4-amino-4-deoxy-L-arabinose transferase-like glycosyltransferase
VKIHSEVSPRSDPSHEIAPDRVGRRAVVGIALVASLGVLPWLEGPMFADEGATLYSGNLSWSDLWAQSQRVDLVLLPYYVLIHFWMLVSGNIAWVRAISLLAFFGTIIAIGWTGLRVAGRWCGIIAAILTATSALLVEKSVNARPYELSTFFVVLCAVVLLRWLEDSRTRWLWVFSLLALFATTLQLFSLLAPMAMLVSVLVIRPELIARRFRLLLAPVGVLAVVSCAWLIACIGEVRQVNWIANESTGARLTAEFRGPFVGQFYDFVLIVIAVIAVTRVAVFWSGGGRLAVIDRVSQDRDILALTVGWAAIPTVVLSLVSFVHPIFSVRYVAASAPAVALLTAFVCVRVFPKTLDPAVYPGGTRQHRAQRRALGAFGFVAVVLLVIGYFVSAAAQQEDLQGPAEYAVQHWMSGDVIALPDHAITSVVDYYSTNDTAQWRLWPQLGVRQRYVEGLDLLVHPSGSLPRRVWLVADGSVPGVLRFERTLIRHGYAVTDFKPFNGASIALFTLPVPTATLPAHSNGATVRGTSALLLTHVYANGLKVTKVQFLLSGNGYHKGVIGTTPHSNTWNALLWNTTTVPNGSYHLQSVATNSAGARGYSAPITINVDN